MILRAAVLAVLLALGVASPAGANTTFQYISLPGPGVQARFRVDPSLATDITIDLLLNNAGPSAYISASVTDSGGTVVQYIIDRTVGGQVSITNMPLFSAGTSVLLADANHYEKWLVKGDNGWVPILIDCFNC